MSAAEAARNARRIVLFDDRYHEVYGLSHTWKVTARALTDAGHVVTLVTTGEGALQRFMEEAGVGVRVVRAPDSLRRFEKQLLRTTPFEKAGLAIDLIRYSRILHAALRDEDVVIASSVRSSLLLLRSRLSRRVKVILYAQNSVPLGLYAALAAIGVDRLALISNRALETFPPWIRRLNRRRLVRWPIARDLTRFDRFEPVRALPAEPLRLLSICLIEDRKGIDVVIRAIALTAKSGLRCSLTVVGTTVGERSERYLESLEALAAALDVEVHYAGYADDVVPWLARADVFVLGSHAEGQPGVLVEAMACALPCIATDVGGCSDLVDDGTTGHVVPPDDPQAFARAIETLGDPTVRAAYGEAGRRRAHERFSMAQLQRTRSRTIEELCGTR